MSVQNPTYLWLALLLIIPLILYLLPMPRRRIAAGALFLWERFLARERFGRTSERFRRALGFALLAGILLCLVLAAADLTAGRPSVKASHVVVLIDNSASMTAVADGISNLDRARSAAADLLSTLDADTTVTLIEAADQVRILDSSRAGSKQALEKLWKIEPFEGAVSIDKAIEQAFELAGAKDPQAMLYVFGDQAAAPGRWAGRGHVWSAPPAGDNVGITQVRAARRGNVIEVSFTIANFAMQPRTVSASVLANGNLARPAEPFTLAAGESAQKSVQFEESRGCRLQIRLEGADALAADDWAYAVVPSLDDQRVAAVWPDIKKRNFNVASVLAALQEQGASGQVIDLAAADAGGDQPAVSVYVNEMPQSWPDEGRDGGCIILYPLKDGVLEVKGVHAQDVTVDRQADHRLLVGADLRGLKVKNALKVEPPAWAEPLVWAGDQCVTWAGHVGRTKVLFVGIPLLQSGSRLPLVASFPTLMANAMEWMLPGARAHAVGADVGGTTSRKAGFATLEAGTGAVSANDAKTELGPSTQGVAFSVASAAESDLRRDGPAEAESFSRRHSLAGVLVAMAILLLGAEWMLFHRRLTE